MVREVELEGHSEMCGLKKKLSCKKPNLYKISKYSLPIVTSLARLLVGGSLNLLADREVGLEGHGGAEVGEADTVQLQHSSANVW